nr:hypothetical protein BCV20_09430 [Vibrio cyclitrophicus]
MKRGKIALAKVERLKLLFLVMLKVLCRVAFLLIFILFTFNIHISLFMKMNILVRMMANYL